MWHPVSEYTRVDGLKVPEIKQIHPKKYHFKNTSALLENAVLSEME